VKVVVNDQTFDITSFSVQWKKNVVKLAEHILSEYQKSSKSRFIVTIAGASGSSKSTTAVVLEHLLMSSKSKVPVVNIGQDGYHFKHDFLEKTLDLKGEPLSNHKGRYDSFDFDSIKSDLHAFAQGKQVAFPSYSRKIHNPIDGAVLCKAGPALLIFEGLWLLYDHKPWNELIELYDFTVFFHTPADIRKLNTITRHIRGDEHSPTAAEIFYEQSDAFNGKCLLAKISDHDFDFYYDS